MKEEYETKRTHEADLFDHIPEWARILADAYLAYCEEMKFTRTKPAKRNDQAAKADNADERVVVY